ncbi:GNAT family N-acetyltransferase [Spongiactinospora rosea]|uniref:GNAT family N-acetyltransferase n=1 Tax=Spongiactinospora rosea TaxID=2248750 RepID=UPI001CED93A4|nr:GNAT family N-acetyltransferase [Spongiactinospora rosea]
MAAGQAEDDFRSVYAEAFAEPPYNETASDIKAAFHRFRSQIRKSTFSGVLARTDEGEPVGIAYGYLLGADTRWWDDVTPAAPEGMRHEDGHRTFGLMELAVRPQWRRRGVARLLHDALLDGTSAERVILNVHPAALPATAAYRAWGYRRVGATRPWAGADRQDVMLLELR